MCYLKRIKVGNFSIEDSLSLDVIEKSSLSDIENKIIKIEDIFCDNEKIILDGNKLDMFLNGVMLKVNNEKGIYKIYNKNKKFIGLGEVNINRLKRDVIV